MSEDLQRNRWWLASDGRWYPPDLHPSVRANTPDVSDRNRALLNATIGVARVRERVFAEVRGEHHHEHSPERDDARGETFGSAGSRDSEQEWALRRETDSPPHFRVRETTVAPRQFREPSQPITSSPEPRWSPGQDDPRQPATRTSSWHDRLEAERHARFTPSTGPTAPASPSSPSLLRRRAEMPAERHWPPTRVTSPTSKPRSPEMDAPLPARPTVPSTVEAGPPPPPLLPPLAETTSPAAQVLPPPAMPPAQDVAEPVQALVEDSPKAPPPPPSIDLLEGRVLLPSARRRPSRVRSTSDLRDAVAGAVARAAAQGPLMPRGPAGDIDSDTSREPDETQVEAESTRPADSVQRRVPADEAQEDDAAFEPPSQEADDHPSDDYVGQGQPAPGFIEADAEHNPVEAFEPPLATVVISGEDSTSIVSHSEAAGAEDESSAPAPALEALRASPISASAASDEAVVEGGTVIAETVVVEAFSGGVLAETTPVETTPPDEVSTDQSLEGPGTQPVPEVPGQEPARAQATETSANEPGSEATGESSTRDFEQQSAPVEPGSEPTTAEDSSWVFGERRSAARQARKPLPAALHEAVAAGAAQDEAVLHPGSGQQSQVPGSRDPLDSSDDRAAGKGKPKPGVLRRYGSAIAIVVVFLAAGGAAAGIAAFRGPVTPPAPTTSARDQAAANSVLLTATDFPSAWQESSGNSPTSYGLGSALVTPSAVSAWLATHGTCSGDLGAVSAAMTPGKDNVTAVAYSQATTTNPLGEPWQIADAVAFNTSASAVSADIAKIRSVLGTAKAQRCVAAFWSTALRAEIPAGSSVMMSVAPRAFPNLPGRPLGWAMEMIGTAVVHHVSLPLRFQITVFAAGRAEVFFVVSSKGAALPGNLARRLLVDLATRVERLAVTPA